MTSAYASSEQLLGPHAQGVSDGEDMIEVGREPRVLDAVDGFAIDPRSACDGRLAEAALHAEVTHCPAELLKTLHGGRCGLQRLLLHHHPATVAKPASRSAPERAPSRSGLG